MLPFVVGILGRGRPARFAVSVVEGQRGAYRAWPGHIQISAVIALVAERQP